MIVFDHLRKTGGTFLKWEFARRLYYAWFYPSGVRYDFSVQPRRGMPRRGSWNAMPRPDDLVRMRNQL